MIVQESLVALATAAVREMVATGDLRPGDKINEPPLAEQLGISRPPLREALRVLATEGILEQSPRRGYRVVALSTDDVREIYGLRRVLEGYALELFEAREEPLDLSTVDAEMARMWAFADEGDAAAVVRANMELHVAIVELTGQQRLTGMYRSLMFQLQLCITVNLVAEAQSVGDLKRGCERHAVLVEALRSGDNSRIRREFVDHGQRDFLAAL
jgi:DNA-binding GntR family transcriptional regulator